MQTPPLSQQVAAVDMEVAEEEASGVEEEELGKSEPTIFRARVPSEVERKKCLCHWELPGNISFNRTIYHLESNQKNVFKERT